MSAPYRVRLRTVAARQLWDGRKARGGRGFIPGIRHFQAGVRALRGARRAGDIDAIARLTEIEAAFEVVERSLRALAQRARRVRGGLACASFCRAGQRQLAGGIEVDSSARAGDPTACNADSGIRRGVRGNRGGDGDGAGSRCIQSAARGDRRAFPTHPLGGLCGGTAVCDSGGPRAMGVRSGVGRCDDLPRNATKKYVASCRR